MQRQGEGDHWTTTRHLDNAAGEDGGHGVANAEADHDEADVADAPAAGDEGLDVFRSLWMFRYSKAFRTYGVVVGREEGLLGADEHRYGEDQYLVGVGHLLQGHGQEFQARKSCAAAHSVFAVPEIVEYEEMLVGYEQCLVICQFWYLSEYMRLEYLT